MERIFNILAGFGSEDDWLPERFYKEDIDVEGNPVHCDRKPFDQMHKEYYKAMGWNEEGNPKEETLKDLDILELLHGRPFLP